MVLEVGVRRFRVRNTFYQENTEYIQQISASAEFGFLYLMLSGTSDDIIERTSAKEHLQECDLEYPQHPMNKIVKQMK